MTNLKVTPTAAQILCIGATTALIAHNGESYVLTSIVCSDTNRVYCAHAFPTWDGFTDTMPAHPIEVVLTFSHRLKAGAQVKAICGDRATMVEPPKTLHQYEALVRSLAKG